MAENNDFTALAIQETNSLIATRNSKVALLLAAQGDEQAILESMRTTSEDPKVVAINQNIDKLQMRLFEEESKRDEILKPLVASFKAESAGNQEALTAEIDTLDSTIRTSKSFLKKMFGESATDKLNDLTARKNRTSEGGTGRRVRGFDVFVDGNLATQRDGQGNEKSSLSAAAKAAGVETSVVQEAFFTAQGTKESKDFKDRVEFNVTDKEGKAHSVVAARNADANEAADEDNVDDAAVEAESASV